MDVAQLLLSTTFSASSFEQYALKYDKKRNKKKNNVHITPVRIKQEPLSQSERVKRACNPSTTTLMRTPTKVQQKTKLIPASQIKKEPQSESNSPPPKPVTPLHRCHICGMMLSKSSLPRHISEIHKKSPRNFSCMTCNEVFDSHLLMRKHQIEEHQQVQQYRCAYCEEPFPYGKDLTRHMMACRNRTNGGKNVKDKENKMIQPVNTAENLPKQKSGNQVQNAFVKSSNEKLNFHDPMQIKKEPMERKLIPLLKRLNSELQNGIKCNICSVVLSAENALSRHIDEVHKKIRRTFKCSTCRTYFDTHLIMRRHQMDVHGFNEHDCNKCLKSFPYRNLLKAHRCPGYGPLKEIKNQNIGKVHQKVTLPRQIISEPQKVAKCDICSKCFSTKWNLERHLKCHLKNNFYPCKMCKDVFFNERGLHGHVQIKHNPFVKMVKTKCETVENGFSRYPNFPMKNAVVRLQRYVERENMAPRNYYCSMCNKSYKAKKSYEDHVKKHLGASFGCKLCPNMYSLKKSLEYHVKTKHYTNNYKCTECKASFANNAQLKDHVRTHVRDVKVMMTRCRSRKPSETKRQQKGSGQKQGVGKSKMGSVVGRKTGFMCAFCPFQHKNLNGIKRHMHLCKKNITLQLVKTAFNKAPKNQKSCHKCTLCAYESINMNDMKSHLLQCRGLFTMKPLSVLSVAAI